MSHTTATANGAKRNRALRNHRGARSVDAIVQQAELPAALSAIVREVVTRCRLWPRERADVARELCAHFTDGLSAGASAESLAEAFGDRRRATRLITSARKNMRPLWWRSARATRRAFGSAVLVCLAVYIILAARFFLTAPRIDRNITNELNAPTLASNPQDRAWPLYLEAKRQFGQLPTFLTDYTQPQPGRPGDANWDQMVAWLEGNAEALELVRQAAAKPLVGVIYGSRMDEEFARIQAEVQNRPFKPEDLGQHIENPMVIGLLLPHLSEMRQFSLRLRWHALHAASRGESEVYIADIEAMLGIAEQTLGEPFMISNLVGVAIAHMTFQNVLEEAAKPDFLETDQLRTLAHLVGGFAGGRMRIDPSFELNFIEDILQRFYSDDGKGDGRFIGGFDSDEMYEEWGVAKSQGWFLYRMYQPVQSVVLPSRKELSQLAHRWIGEATADDLLPPWRHDERKSDEFYEQLMNSGIFNAVPFLESLQGNSYEVMGRASTARDSAETVRSAALTALALESWRRRHGHYPAALSELVPTYLPTMPRDPFDGKPLRYVAPTASEATPLLYSIGVDGVDDHGRAPATERGRSMARRFDHFHAFHSGIPAATNDERLAMDAARGDWILWPALEPIIQVDEAYSDD
ncbi:MAG: hypothetical protein KF757_07270 [Phycisphaeraceae bacterium]|nr:hypothetical protein [Phycisphaeraceae bacterium]MCW5763393.1 hypothetical protein [Phycisphaeraceae bacterium]